jgi:hypothetical protein
MQRLRRFSKYWELVGNSGNFLETLPFFWRGSRDDCIDLQSESEHSKHSCFYNFLRWTDWLFERVGRTDSIALVRLMELIFQYLTIERELPAAEVANSLWRDYQRGGRKDKPVFLKDYLPKPAQNVSGKSASKLLPSRQALHADAAEPKASRYLAQKMFNDGP